MSARVATHAGSWYPKSEKSLRTQLQAFADATDPTCHAIPGCRIVISPHAGYSYSGPTAAHGFKALDWRGIRRVFILGPSHHFYLRGCALTPFNTYQTPLGDLEIDLDTVRCLRETGRFEVMSEDVDEDEHSIEMQLPFLRLIMPHAVPVVPILVGNLTHEAEDSYGRLLAEYVEDKENLFVISSDFCHWGNRFSYTYYQAPDSRPIRHVTAASITADCAIWESIERLDKEGMELITHRDPKHFTAYLARTKNTICGRHPIGVILAALERLKLPGDFHFLDYRQSNRVTNITDGSVSYASGVYRS